MPLCYIFTNLEDSKTKEDLEENLQKCIEDMLNKPAGKITVLLNAGIRMRFGGKKQPGMVCNIRATGAFDKERNAAYFPKLFKVLTTATGLPASSITIELTDLQGGHVMNGTDL